MAKKGIWDDGGKGEGRGLDTTDQSLEYFVFPNINYGKMSQIKYFKDPETEPM